MERKRWEEELKEANKELKAVKEAAEAAGRAKLEFLANMSPETRTPMNAMIGMTCLLLGENLTLGAGGVQWRP